MRALAIIFALTFALTFAFAAGCRARPECVPRARSMSSVVVELAFTRAQEGVTDGFDIDGRKSTDQDAKGCFQPDFTSPDGVAGIDNQLAVLLPIVDAQTGGALEGAIQGAVNNGQLLFAVTVDDVDDLCNDDAVTVRMERLTGVPLVDADSRLDPWQTFDLLPDTPAVTAKAHIKNGVVEAGPTSLDVPVAVLDAQFTVRFHEGRLRMRFDEDDNLDVLVGGGIDREELMADVRGFTIPQSLVDTFDSALSLFSDLDPDGDGKCRAMSASVHMSARPVFISQ